jgi:phage terminase large subunit-like protein
VSYTLTAFAKFCRSLRLESGEPMKLEAFERLMLAEHFEGATEVVIVIPKKNGKTTLLGALALFHLAEVPEAEIVIGASSRDQARILFKQAAGLVRRSPDVYDLFDVKGGYGEIRIAGAEKDGPRIRVLAADANTADGVIPTLALVDELHRHPSGDLYGVFRDGLGPRRGQMATISTAGVALDSPLGLLRVRAHGLESFRRDAAAKHNYAATASGDFVLHEWCLEGTEDVDDLRLVEKANPASWQTVEALRRRHESPTMTPWQWRRFACGIWTEGEEPWIDPRAWDDLADPALVIPDGAEVWLGVDIGVRHDSTAIVVAHRQDDDRIAVQATILEPPPHGNLPLERVEQAIRDLAREFRVLGVFYDPWTFRRSAEILEDDGLEVVEFPQSAERMASASANLYRLVETGDLVHDGDPVLRSHVMAGATKETERGWRLVKDPKSRRPVDALIAMAIACLPAVNQGSREPQVAFV